MTNNIIPVEISKRFNVFELCGFEIPEGTEPAVAKNFYKDFLRKTDYIPAKIMEAQLAGETLDEDYTSILRYRQLAREQVNLLDVEIQKKNSSSDEEPLGT